MREKTGLMAIGMYSSCVLFVFYFTLILQLKPICMTKVAIKSEKLTPVDVVFP